MLTTRQTKRRKLLADPQQNVTASQYSDLYLPLRTDIGEIRILVVGPGSLEDKLNLRLEYWPLQARLQYETLSYCWGDERCDIEVEGKKLRVPTSVRQALRQFRLHKKERYLWIDSICLNQADEDEKECQIARMHIIYEGGTTNLVFLGQDDDGTACDAFATLLRLEAEFEKEAERRGGVSQFAGQISRSAVSDGGTLDFDPVPVGKIFARPVFQRLWIIQEVFLSRRSIAFCGPNQISLTTLHRATCWLMYNRQHLSVKEHLRDNDIRQVARLGYYADAECNFLSRPSGAQKVKWSRLLTHQSTWSVKEPRDRIYGLLGIYQRSNDLNKVPDLLRPNYQLSLMELYRNATRYAMQSQRDVSVLFQIRKPCVGNVHNDDEKWPSWVPCLHHLWDVSTHEQSLAHFFRANLEQPQDFRNDDGMSLDAITVRGIRGDTPSSGSEVQSITNALTERSMDCVTSFLNQVLSITTAASHAVAETLMAGTNHSHLRATVHDCDGLKILLQYLEITGVFPPLPGDLPAVSDEVERAAHFLHAIWKACFARRFFVTRSGRIGLGPQTMEVGDCVVVLWGGKYPFVLKPTAEAGRYVFVGQCYVQGIMEGEAVREWRKTGRVNEEFVLV